MSLWGFSFLVAIVVLWVVWQVRRRLKRSNEVRDFALAHGLEFDRRDPHDLRRRARLVFPDERFTRQVGNTSWGHWGGHRVLAGDMVTGTRQKETVRMLSMVSVELPISGPDTVWVVPHDLWSRARAKLGAGRLPVASEEFNARYAIHTDAKKFALELLDASLVGWLLNLDRRFGFLVAGNVAVFTSDGLRGPELEKLFDAATGFVDRLPRSVLEAYAS